MRRAALRCRRRSTTRTALARLAPALCWLAALCIPPGAASNLELHARDGVPSLDTDHPAIVQYGLIIPRKATWTHGREPKMKHSVTLLEVAPGQLLAAWFGGTWEGRPDTAIHTARYRDGQWGEHRQIPKQGKVPMWNPVLCAIPQANETLLFYKIGTRIPDWAGVVVRSHDSGRSWGRPVRLGELPHRLHATGPVKNKCLLTHNGTLVAGTSREVRKPGAPDYATSVKWTVHIEYSHNRGHRWHRTRDIPFEGNIIQPALFHDSDGNVRMVARHRGYASSPSSTFQKGHVVVAKSHSHDGLSEWEGFRETSLPCPNSGIDAVRLADGRILLIYNHSNRMKYAGRSIINAALSYDDGETWRPVMTLDHSPDVVKEFSYPAVIQAADGLVHISYTHSSKQVVTAKSGRENLRHIILDPTRLDLEYWRAVKLRGEYLEAVAGNAARRRQTVVVEAAAGVAQPPEAQPWEAALAG